MTEDYLRAVGEWSKWLLNRMFGDDVQMVGAVSPQQAWSYVTEEDQEKPQQKVDFVN